MIRVNPLPGPTWHWLRVNDTGIRIPEEASEALTELTLAPGISDKALLEEEDASGLATAESGMGQAFAGWMAACPVDPVTLTASVGMEAERPVVVRLFASGGEMTANRYQLIARKNSEMTVVMYLSGEDLPGAGETEAGEENIEEKKIPEDVERPKTVGMAVDTRILVEDGAKVHLVQVCDGGRAVSTYCDVAAVLGEKSEFSVLQITTGERNAFFGVAADLAGKESKLYIDTAYTAEDKQMVDINYVARHKGVRTNSEIHVNGVLNSGSAKVFRGTIDFLRGASEAKGEEREDVLLMDPDVMNKTIPLILCKEEDVEGEHGATIGDISEESLYYFRSRGIPDEEAYGLIANGRMMNAVRMIPAEDIRDMLLTRLGELEAEE